MLKNKIINLDTVIEKTVEGEDDTLSIMGYASTVNKDRASDVILAKAWKGGLKNYEKNPILLFNHDYNSPIGKVTEMSLDDNGLKITGNISKSSGNIRELIKEGILSTFSVGFLIKDADYDKINEGLIIKSAELLEVSVVSVPCNQDATFSVAKSFDTTEEYHQFKKQFAASEIDTTEVEGDKPRENITMDEEKIASLMAGILEKNQQAADEKAAKEKAAKDAEDALEKKIAEAVATATTKVTQMSEEKLLAEVEKRVANETTTLNEKLVGISTELAEKNEEIRNLINSKKDFNPQGSGAPGTWRKEFSQDAEDAYLLGRITNKGYDTKFAKDLLEKVNSHSSVEVSSEDFEKEVSTNVERDIWNKLILAPMFREVKLNAANLVVPIMPDIGYAEITAAAGSTDATPTNGTLDTRGGPDRGGVKLQEINLSTVKMIAKSYLGNETEEDAIMPILPLIREAMIRQHTRGVENLILLGGHTDGQYSAITAAQGLLKYASTQSRDLNTGSVGSTPALTAASLLSLRKNMGKYGIQASDVKYIVSQRAYFELIEDPEFQDYNLVRDEATKLTGQVGRVFGSDVMLCDEFPAPGAGKYYALAVNTRNFVVPRLRGVTVESEYSVEDQHRVMVTSQRLGFKEIIPNATSVIGLKYPAAS